MKNKKVPVLITIFSFVAITLVSSVLAAPPQAAPLSQMICEPIASIPISISGHGSGEKPQSKVWQHGSEWWAVFPSTTSGASSAGTWVWKLTYNGSTYSWSEVLKISSRTDTKADVKRDGNVTHVLLFADSSPSDTELVSLEYTAGTYQVWSTRPTAASIALAGSSPETATIDLDTTGRMWLATQDGSNMIVYYSDSPYSNWSNTFTVGTGTSSDDISAVTAIPGGLIGVLWSDQSGDDVFKFRIHVDGDSPTSWSSEESISGGSSFSDDHINVAVASDGTFFAAIKTSYSSATIELLVREAGGTWRGPFEVDTGDSVTRPIVALNEAAGVVDVIYPIKDAGIRPMIYKEASTSDLANISFGGRITLLSGEYNDPSGMKENYVDELVTIFAGDNAATMYGSYCKSAVSTPEADLGVTKVDVSDPIYVGYNATYTVTVTNNGPDTAESVVMTDTLPAGMHYISAIPDQGSCGESSGEITCSLNDLNNSAQVGISIVVSTTQTGILTNNVVVSSDTLDNNSANDNADEDTTVNACTAPCGVTQDISLALGWNLISSYVDPQNPDIEMLFKDIENKVIIVRDGDGNVYWPLETINNIHDWNVNKGYQVLTNASATLSITGIQVDPAQTPISLPAGWNLIPYLRDSSLAINNSLSTINSQLVLAKDGTGQLYWPDYDVNQIGSQQPDLGYQIYMSSAGTLTYPAN